MELEDMRTLVLRARDCAERARQEEAFWEGLIAERLAEDGDTMADAIRAAA